MEHLTRLEWFPIFFLLFASKHSERVYRVTRTSCKAADY